MRVKKTTRGAIRSQTEYTTKDTDYTISGGDDTMNININNITPQQLRHKSPAQLMANVSNFMQSNIMKINKTTDKGKTVQQKDIDLHNAANMAAACLVKYVNKTNEGGQNFTSLEDMSKHMANKASAQVRGDDRQSSEDNPSDEYVESD